MRSVLRGLLDDDHDMWLMHLSARELQRQAAKEAAAHMMAEVEAMAAHAPVVHHHQPVLEKVGPWWLDTASRQMRKATAAHEEQTWQGSGA